MMIICINYYVRFENTQKTLPYLSTLKSELLRLQTLKQLLHLVSYISNRHYFFLSLFSGVLIISSKYHDKNYVNLKTINFLFNFSLNAKQVSQAFVNC